MSLTLKAFLGYLVSKTFAVSGSPSAHYWRLCIYWRPQNTYCQKTSGQCEIPMMSISYVMSVLMKVFFKPNNSSRTQFLQHPGLAASNPRGPGVRQWSLSLSSHLTSSYSDNHDTGCSRWIENYTKSLIITNFKLENMQKLSLLNPRGLCRGESGNWGRRKRSWGWGEVWAGGGLAERWGEGGGGDWEGWRETSPRGVYQAGQPTQAGVQPSKSHCQAHLLVLVPQLPPFSSQAPHASILQVPQWLDGELRGGQGEDWGSKAHQWMGLYTAGEFR